MKKLVLAVLVLVAGVLWLLPRRAPEREGGPEPAHPARAQTPAAPLVPPGPTSAAGERPARERLEEEAATPGPGEAPSPVPAESEELASFHGQVLDALTQRPLAGVRALVSRAQRRARPDELEEDEIVCQATSDAEGRFELPLADRPVAALGHLLADGYGAASFLMNRAHDSRATALILELLPAGLLEVEVTDLAGAPVPGAKVELVKPSAMMVGANSVLNTPALSWVEHTRDTGVASFTGLPAEIELAWTVLAAESGRAGHVALAPGETRRLPVVLGGVARVFGHVRDEQGAPVPGLDLWLAQADAADRRAKEALAKARSDDNGRFEFTGVPFETLVLGPAPGAQDFVAREHQVIVVDRPVIERDLAVRHGLFVSGRITGDPQEIEGISFVNVQRLDGTYVDSDTLARATFRLGPLAPGEYLLTGSGAYRGTAIVRVAAGASDVELPLLERREVRLSIEGSAGPFELRVRDIARGPIWMWTENDALSVVPLVPGRYALLASAPGDLVGYRAFELREGVPLEELVVRLDAAARCTFVHRASEGTRTLELFVDGAPYVPEHKPGAALAAGAALTLLLPARPLVAELREGERVVASRSLNPAPGERLRVELVPR